MKKKLFLFVLLVMFLLPVYAKEDKYKIVSGDIKTVGSEVCFDTECFYVIGNEDGIVKLLGKYNLYVGLKYEGRKSYDYGDLATGLQHSSMLGGGNLLVGTIEGIVTNFADSTYWSDDVNTYPAYVFNENSLIYEYIKFYSKYLNSIGVALHDARLISYEELVDLGCSVEDKKCTNAPSWVYSTSYWTGSANDYNQIWQVNKTGSFNHRLYARCTLNGVRPVIEIQNSWFEYGNEVYSGIIKEVDSSDGVVSNDANGIDLVFNDLGQEVKYETVIYNNTSQVMYVNDIEVYGLSEDFIKVRLDAKSENMMIEPNGSSLVTFSVETLVKDGAGRNLNDKIKVDFKLSDKMLNPNTFSNFLELTILLIILGASLFLLRKCKNMKIYSMILFSFCLLSGIRYAYAYDFIVVRKVGHIKYESQNIIEPTGTILENKKVDYTNSNDVWVYYDKVKNIEVKSLMSKPKDYFKEFDLTENKNGRVMAYLIENNDKDIPYNLVIMSNGVVVANSDSSFMFSFSNVKKIEGFSNIDFRNVNTMKGMFVGNKNLKTIDVESIDMDNVSDVSYMFYGCDNIVYTKADFNLKNVEISTMMFTDNLYNEIKMDAQSDSTLNYGSSSGNGKYFVSSTKEDEFPIYFYRGNVIDNNVIFGGFCWKIVRTTDIGGTKIIYNGVPTDGKCENSSNNVIGTTEINTNNLSITDAGYMYGDKYGISTFAMNGSNMNLFDKTDKPVSNSSYYYSKKFIYDGLNYTLVDPKLISWSSNSHDMIGYYTCLSATDFICEELAYVFSSNNDTLYMSNVVDGNEIAAKNITLYKNAVSLSKNVFKLGEPVIIDKIDYTKNYANYINYFLCNSSDISNCSSTKLIYETSSLSYMVRSATVMYFANSYKYENGVYKLNDYYKSNGNFIGEYDMLANYRYTCGVYGTECTYLYFITRNRDDGYIHVISFDKGLTIDDVLANATKLNNSSLLKQTIDLWYKNNMTSYTNMLEDTVWYNEKDFSTGAFGGAAGNVGSFYSGYDRILNYKTPWYKYKNKNDMFTVSDKIGNGALDYPVGTITVDELAYSGLRFDGANSSNYLKSDYNWWTMTPSDLSYNSPSYVSVSPSNLLQTERIGTSYGVRPMISLKHGFIYSDGDGTSAHPYIIE